MTFSPKRQEEPAPARIDDSEALSSHWDFEELDMPVQPKRFPFRAELDLTELDDRRRAGTTWVGRGIELSRSHLVFRARRMCYEGRYVLVAVHLVDDEPVPLLGEVIQCMYDGDAMYRTEIRLEPVPEIDTVRSWLKDRSMQGRLA